MLKDRKEFKRLLKQCEDYAKDNGFHLNPRQKVVNYLVEALLKREKKYGKRYCPCRRIEESQKGNNKIVCPCIYCKEEIKKDGHCHCFLFVK
jgi:ferredoxin-thioredoxin reductase catalytic chain